MLVSDDSHWKAVSSRVTIADGCAVGMSAQGRRVFEHRNSQDLERVVYQHESHASTSNYMQPKVDDLTLCCGWCSQQIALLPTMMP